MTSFIAKRLHNFDSSKIRAAFDLGEDIPGAIDLSIGFPEDDTPNYIKLAGIEAINKNYTRYTATNGLAALRIAIADKLVRENCIASNMSAVTVTPGVTIGILLAYLATLDPGDEVLIPEPYFPPYKDLAIMLGAKVVLINTEPSFRLRVEAIASKITSRSKILVINSPNNPSGAIYPRTELVKIAALARKHNLLVISDEIYEHFAYDKEHFSIGSIYKNTLTLNGFSKGYAMTGWRIGYIYGPKDIIEAVNELQQYTVFASSSISQHAALTALRRNPRAITARYKAKRDTAKATLQKTFPNIQGAQGAFYFFLKLPDGIEDMRFVNHLAHRGVIVLPGSAFSRSKDYIRISFAAKKVGLIEGLKRICQSVDIMKDARR